jgi:hypothetical protein
LQGKYEDLFNENRILKIFASFVVIKNLELCEWEKEKIAINNVNLKMILHLQELESQFKTDGIKLRVTWLKNND